MKRKTKAKSPGEIADLREAQIPVAALRVTAAWGD